MRNPSLPDDHTERMARARLALDGLSVGDGFGGQFFKHRTAESCLAQRRAPPGPWRYTDDTEMALAVFEVLERHGHVHQDDLAAAFARRYEADMYRGYGPSMHHILPAIGRGVPWQTAARETFDGQGSLGNGSAMRVAPVGAYFPDDFGRTVREAQASAEVTHAHPDGAAGAIATAIATAYAWRFACDPSAHRVQSLPSPQLRGFLERLAAGSRSTCRFHDRGHGPGTQVSLLGLSPHLA